MTEQEFRASLTKEQKKFFEGCLREAISLEEQYYKENMALKREIMLLLYALNFEPIQSVPQLADMVRKTLERLRKEKRIPPKRQEEMQNEIEFIRARMNGVAHDLNKMKDTLESL